MNCWLLTSYFNLWIYFPVKLCYPDPDMTHTHTDRFLIFNFSRCLFTCCPELIVLVSSLSSWAHLWSTVRFQPVISMMKISCVGQHPLTLCLQQCPWSNQGQPFTPMGHPGTGDYGLLGRPNPGWPCGHPRSGPSTLAAVWASPDKKSSSSSHNAHSSGGHW